MRCYNLSDVSTVLSEYRLHCNRTADTSDEVTRVFGCSPGFNTQDVWPAMVLMILAETGASLSPTMTYLLTSHDLGIVFNTFLRRYTEADGTPPFGVVTRCLTCRSVREPNVCGGFLIRTMYRDGQRSSERSQCSVRDSNWT